MVVFSVLNVNDIFGSIWVLSSNEAVDEAAHCEDCQACEDKTECGEDLGKKVDEWSSGLE